MLLRRHHFHPSSSSALARLLSAWGVCGDDSRAEAEDTAQHLGRWLGVPDAIRLHAAHQSLPGLDGAAARRAAIDVPALEEQSRQLRQVLEQAIRGENPLRDPLARTRAGQDASEEAQGVHALLHQRHLELQRRMELRIDALRAHLRQVLSRAAPALARLAVLDALMDDALSARERKLLAALPQVLERRFHALRKQSTGTHDEETAAPADWLAAFVRDWQSLLLAELDARLQPVAGLLEALRSHNEPRTP